MWIVGISESEDQNDYDETAEEPAEYATEDDADERTKCDANEVDSLYSVLCS